MIDLVSSGGCCYHATDERPTYPVCKEHRAHLRGRHGSRPQGYSTVTQNGERDFSIESRKVLVVLGGAHKDDVMQ